MGKDASLTEGERIVMTMHPHWKTLLRPAVILVLLVVFAVAVVLIIPSGPAATTARLVVVVAAVVAAAAGSGIPVLRWRAATYELTTRRLRMREGILSRGGRDVPLDHINDVSFSHGLIDRMLGCGRLAVESAGRRLRPPEPRAARRDTWRQRPAAAG